MRTVGFILVIILLLGAALFLRALYEKEPPFDPSPPGQYPLAADRFVWPATTATKAFGPSKSMGTNAVAFAGGADLKATCATAPTCTQ